MSSHFSQHIGISVSNLARILFGRWIEVEDQDDVRKLGIKHFLLIFVLFARFEKLNEVYGVRVVIDKHLAVQRVYIRLVGNDLMPVGYLIDIQQAFENFFFGFFSLDQN